MGFYQVMLMVSFFAFSCTCKKYNKDFLLQIRGINKMYKQILETHLIYYKTILQYGEWQLCESIMHTAQKYIICSPRMMHKNVVFCNAICKQQTTIMYIASRKQWRWTYRLRPEIYDKLNKKFSIKYDLTTMEINHFT